MAIFRIKRFSSFVNPETGKMSKGQKAQNKASKNQERVSNFLKYKSDSGWENTAFRKEKENLSYKKNANPKVNNSQESALNRTSRRYNFDNK